MSNYDQVIWDDEEEAPESDDSDGDVIPWEDDWSDDGEEDEWEDYGQ